MLKGFLLTLFGFNFLFIPELCAVQPVTLKEIKSLPVELPALKKLLPPSAFKYSETPFPLAEAVNFKEVSEFIGPLTPGQRKFLEQNRFLILPKKFFLLPGGDNEAHDEMLANFEALSGPAFESSRQAHHSRYIGPDVILHAFARYQNIRWQQLEQNYLSEQVELFLAQLYRNAKILRQKSESPSSFANWERLLGQLAVPLILIRNGQWPLGGNSPGEASDSFANALKLLAEYQGDWSPYTRTLVQWELERVFQAEITAPNLLGLSPSTGELELDYRLFRPQGHYALDGQIRSYYRAMTWLTYYGWSLAAKESLADALNWSLALSYEPERDKEAMKHQLAEQALPSGQVPVTAVVDLNKAESKAAASQGAHQRWQKIMDITQFFQGAADNITYVQWLPFLMKEAEVPVFTAETSANEEILMRLLNAGANFKTPLGHHFNHTLHRPTVLPIFPRRLSLTDVLIEELTYREGEREFVPANFSSLWLPVFLGQEYARKQVARQMAVQTVGEEEVLENKASRDLIRLASTDLLRLVDDLRLAAKSESPLLLSRYQDAWYLAIWDSLLVSFAANYPLYMQNKSFQARQLEQTIGSWTQLEAQKESPGSLNSATLSNLTGASQSFAPIPSESSFSLYSGEVQSFAPRTDDKSQEKPRAKPQRDTAEPAPLVKGFVEPNIAFWQEMLSLTLYLAKIYETYGLFAEDLKSDGALSRFQKRLERCLALAEKELLGEELSNDDYEFIRLFTLDFMAKSQKMFDKSLVPSGCVTETQKPKPGQVDERLKVICDGNGPPNLMVVLVGNEDSPRACLGLVYNHYEFEAPGGRPLTSAQWQKIVYVPATSETQALPFRKNFWYAPLKP